MGKLNDLAGRQFGEWTVLQKADQSYRGNARWVCRCSCGVERTVTGTNLRSGCSRSCGHDKLTAGGLSRRFPSEHATWYQMHCRCADPGHPRYYDWGGRGIKVCDRWYSFEAFLADMGPRPFPSAQLDRTDNEDGYHPLNCRWVTPMENAQNSTAIRFLEHGGLKLSVVQWARRLGIKPQILYSRLYYGWSVERTLTQPVRGGRP